MHGAFYLGDKNEECIIFMNGWIPSHYTMEKSNAWRHYLGVGKINWHVLMEGRIPAIKLCKRPMRQTENICEINLSTYSQMNGYYR